MKASTDAVMLSETRWIEVVARKSEDAAVSMIAGAKEEIILL